MKWEEREMYGCKAWVCGKGKPCIIQDENGFHMGATATGDWLGTTDTLQEAKDYIEALISE